ncbi:site-specific recombinase XerD [Brevibacterium sanguinis]|uniref:Site-specific recombinase XerD n=2 Tax=Brevibacterium TaxID=1696 RepID=A0A366IIA7_9MICO|nr:MULTISPECIES: tyrosine-type recombinase/integrase [Brevibacterium]RBP64152.1 site-specific recombinase XerD [Brevibacterium sanguinis]RBP71556.1 site-specific recombinase XerD [Brevibacterium celere]
MATIEAYETKAGKRYRVQYTKPDGNRTMKRGFATKRDANDWLAQTQVNVASGSYVAPSAGRVTVGSLWPAWYKRKSRLKKSTLRGYETAWRVHVEPVWGSRAVATIKPTAVEDWIAELSGSGKSATVVKRANGVLSGILADAVKDQRIASNPAAKPENMPKKSSRDHVYLTHQQVQTMADSADGQWSTLILFACYTGLRWGELTGLRVKALDMLRRRVRVAVNAVEVGSTIVEGEPKSWERRWVPFPKFLAPLLAQQCEGKQPDDLVFTAPLRGGFMRHPKTGKGWFHRASLAAGAEGMVIHDMRATAASLAVSAGANVKVIQRMLGHKSAAMTLDTYSDLFDDDLNAVSDALDSARSAQLSQNVSQKRVNSASE